MIVCRKQRAVGALLRFFPRRPSKSSRFLSSRSQPELRPVSVRLFEAFKLQVFTRREFEEVFDRIDADKNGKLDKSEVLHFLGPELTKGLVQEMARRDPQVTSLSKGIGRDAFVDGLDHMARRIDSRVWSIAFSTLLTGTAVGIVVPVLPLFVSNHLQGTSLDFALVIGAFAVSKMLGNVPSAVLADAIGRKPVLSWGMGLIAIGTGGIVFSDTLAQLMVSRLITGAGVAAFTTASTLYLADVSTPLNRASSMAPILVAFSAGTALGPAMGGVLADIVGVNACFGVTALCFSGLTIYNHIALSETLPKDLRKDTQRMGVAALEAFRSWAPIIRDPKLRSVFLVNGAYWIAISGAQTTLLPLVLSSDGFSATEIGMVFGAISSVYVLGSQPAGYLADRYGKVPCIIGSCGIIAMGIGLFPSFYPALSLWAIGGTLLGVSPTAYVVDRSSPQTRSQALAVLRTIGDVGLLMGSASSGFLADRYGFPVAMQTNAALLGATTMLFAYSTMPSFRSIKPR